MKAQAEAKESKEAAKAATKAKAAKEVIAKVARGKAPAPAEDADDSHHSYADSHSEDYPIYDEDGEMPKAHPPRISTKAAGKRPAAPAPPSSSPEDSGSDSDAPPVRKPKAASAKPAQDPDDESDDDGAAKQGRTTRHSSLKACIGKTVDVKLQGGKMTRGELLEVRTSHAQEFVTYADDITGERNVVDARHVTIASSFYQSTPTGLRPRDLSAFVAGRGNVIFAENLTFAKKTGPQTAGMPFTIIHTSETGFQGFGTMGDVAKSETTFVFSELPIHHVGDDPSLNLKIGDLVCFPDDGTVTAKVTKTSARATVTGTITGDCFEMWGGAVPAQEVKDRLMPKESEIVLAKVAQFGRPGQEQWVDYIKVWPLPLARPAVRPSMPLQRTPACQSNPS